MTINSLKGDGTMRHLTGSLLALPEIERDSLELNRIQQVISLRSQKIKMILRHFLMPPK